MKLLRQSEFARLIGAHRQWVSYKVKFHDAFCGDNEPIIFKNKKGEEVKAYIHRAGTMVMLQTE